MSSKEEKNDKKDNQNNDTNKPKSSIIQTKKEKE